ncbi:MAG: DUF2892 domain-containing protein [Polyangiaceae bacterium]
MTRNVGNWDRIGRGIAALLMITCAVLAPLPLGVRIAALGLPALYMAFTALRGTCVGYRLMGMSTCPTSPR